MHHLQNIKMKNFRSIECPIECLFYLEDDSVQAMARSLIFFSPLNLNHCALVLLQGLCLCERKIDM